MTSRAERLAASSARPLRLARLAHAEPPPAVTPSLGATRGSRPAGEIDIYAGIENSGAAIQEIIAAFGDFSLLASKYLQEEGLGEPDEDGRVEIAPDGWYPVEKLRRVLHRIAEEVGQQVVRQVGEHIPELATFPRRATHIESALESMDAAMHLAHRKDGAPMFDPRTGRMREGIGHLRYFKVPGAKEIRMTSTSPYPCAMDLGFVSAMARRFEPGAKVVHDPASCKDKGGFYCRYTVTWD